MPSLMSPNSKVVFAIKHNLKKRNFPSTNELEYMPLKLHDHHLGYRDTLQIQQEYYSSWTIDVQISNSQCWWDQGWQTALAEPAANSRPCSAIATALSSPLHSSSASYCRPSPRPTQNRSAESGRASFHHSWHRWVTKETRRITNSSDKSQSTRSHKGSSFSHYWPF